MNQNLFLPGLSGSQFLHLYIPFSVGVALLVCCVQRYIACKQTKTSSTELSLMELAMLSGAQAHRIIRNVIEAALFSLAKKQYVIIEDDLASRNKTVERQSDILSEFGEVEHAIYGELESPRTNLQLQDALGDRVGRMLAPVRERLEERRLLLTQQETAAQRYAAMMGFILIATAAAARIFGAICSGRPFGILIFYAIVFAIIYFKILKPSEISSLGANALRILRVRESYSSKLVGTGDLSPDSITFLVALFGAGILNGTLFDGFNRFLIPAGASAGSGAYAGADAGGGAEYGSDCSGCNGCHGCSGCGG